MIGVLGLPGAVLARQSQGGLETGQFDRARSRTAISPAVDLEAKTLDVVAEPGGNPPGVGLEGLDRRRVRTIAPGEVAIGVALETGRAPPAAQGLGEFQAGDNGHFGPGCTQDGGAVEAVVGTGEVARDFEERHVGDLRGCFQIGNDRGSC